MSHQTKQQAFMQINDLNLLETGVRGIHIEQLKTSLVLNRDQKSARYYGTRMDSDNVEAVITFARPLTDTEKQSFYEIAVKRGKDKDGNPTYELFADTNAGDRTMQRRIEQVFENYAIEKIGQDLIGAGATGFSRVEDADVPDGFIAMEVQIP